MTTGAFEALIALQDLDTAIDQAAHRYDHLPERAALDATRAERAALAARRAGPADVRDSVAARQAQLEAELAATEQRSAEVSKRLYSGEVRASRDLQALSADIELLKERSSRLEDDVLAVMEEREPLDAALDALEVEDAAAAEREAVAEGELSGAEERAGAERDELRALRPPAAELVPSALLAAYDRLRARLGGVGAARLVGDHCSGCHLVLPATELDRIRHLPPDELVTCDHCGRILVRTQAAVPPPPPG